MKKSLLALLAILCLCVGYANAATVYFENTANWSGVYYHMWNGSNNTNWNTCPKATSTTTISGRTFYVIDAGDAKNILFKNQAGAPTNNCQTKDLTVVNNYVFSTDNTENATPIGQIVDGNLVYIEPDTKYYLIGQFNDWKGFEKLTYIGNDNWEGKITSGEFLITNANNWENKKFGGATINGDGEFQLYENANNNEIKNSSTTEVTIVFNSVSNKLIVTGFPEPEEGTWTAFLNGSPNTLEKNENGFPYFDTSVLGSNSSLGRQNLEWRFSNGTTNLTYSGEITENGTYDLIEGSGTFKVPNPDNAAYTITIDPDTKTMVVTGLNLIIDTDWYLSYNNAATAGWEFNRPMSVQPDGTYSCVITVAAGDNDNKNWLTITKGKIKGDWDTSGCTRYGATGSGDYAINGNVSNLEMVSGSTNCWTLKAGGTWTVTINPTTNKISFTLGDVAVVSRRPSNVWLIGSFNDWAIPTESGGATEANGGIQLNQDPENENVFVGTYLWRDEDVNFTMVGTYSATDAANWYGPKNGVDVVIFTDSDDDGIFSYDGEAAVFTQADGAISSRYWDVDDQDNINANTILTVKFTYKFNDATNEDESTVEFSYDPTPVIADMDGQKIIYSNDGWATYKTAPLVYQDTRDWTGEIPESAVVPGKTLCVALSEKLADGTIQYYLPGKATEETYDNGDKVYRIILGPTEMIMGSTGVNGIINTTMETCYTTTQEGYNYTYEQAYWTYSPEVSTPVYVALDRNNLLVAFSKEEIMTGVDEVEAIADGEAVYFNMQGVRVANPINGLYIRVQGGKASKVML